MRTVKQCISLQCFRFIQFCTHDRKDHEILWTNQLQSYYYKAPSSKQLYGELLHQAYKSTEQLPALILSISYGWISVDHFIVVSLQSSWASANGQLWMLGHNLFNYMHNIQGWSLVHVHHTRFCLCSAPLRVPMWIHCGIPNCTDMDSYDERDRFCWLSAASCVESRARLVGLAG